MLTDNFHLTVREIVLSLGAIENTVSNIPSERTHRICSAPQLLGIVCNINIKTRKGGRHPNSGRKSKEFIKKNLKRQQTIRKLANRRKHQQAKFKRMQKTTKEG